MENVSPRMYEGERYRPVVRQSLNGLAQFKHLSREDRLKMIAVTYVLPFKSNSYVIENLIDWDNIPNDPIYQLTFPQQEMLEPDDLDEMVRLVRKEASLERIKQAADRIRLKMNPHPAGQLKYNVPIYKGRPIAGMQHKYSDTCLLFPKEGQTCHAYCTYCFRWVQFVGMEKMKFAARHLQHFHAYLKEHKEISDVLLTGGDPMIMSTEKLRSYVEPLLQPGYEHITQIRIGTKALAYWPQRFVSDPDADDMLRLLRKIRSAGKLPAIMAHFSHPVELSTPIVRQAISRINMTGAVIRTQAPLIRHVNDKPEVWSEMWKEQVRLGCIPYYMFVERDTGPKCYFEVPLADGFDIFTRALLNISGLARTVRGPSMSTMPGKVQIVGTTEIQGQKVFMLVFLRARNPKWVRVPFFAKYDEKATWLTDLKPAFDDKFFYEDELKTILQQEYDTVQNLEWF